MRRVPYKSLSITWICMQCWFALCVVLGNRMIVTWISEIWVFEYLRFEIDAIALI